MNVTLTDDQGRQYDVTEHFQVMYDQLVGGMDWGSGFLDLGEALVVMQAGAAAGFEINIYETGLPREEFMPPKPQDTSPYNRDWDSWYKALERSRTQWIKDNLGDPPTWDSIQQYRHHLAEMENSLD